MTSSSSVGPEAGRAPNPDSLAAQRERESGAKEELSAKTADALGTAKQTLDALSRAAQEGKESVADLYETGKEAVSAAIDKKLGDLGRWFDRKTDEVSDAVSAAGRNIDSVVVATPADIKYAVDTYKEGYRNTGYLAHETTTDIGRAVVRTGQDMFGITAVQEDLAATRAELAATRRTLEAQAATTGATARTDVCVVGVEAGTDEPEQKTVQSENGVNVRANASPSATKVDTLPKGAQVSLVPADPVDSGGYAWRRIAGPENKWVASGPTTNPNEYLA